MRIRLLAPTSVGLVAALLLASHDAPAQEAPTLAESLESPTFGDETVGAEEIPGEIAIDLRDDATAGDVADLDAKLGIVMHPSSAWSTTHDMLEVADVDPAS